VAPTLHGAGDKDVSKREWLQYFTLATVTAAVTCGEAQADGLPGFKKDMRPVRMRGKVDPSEFKDGPDGLK
jgi:hypothetical protein